MTKPELLSQSFEQPRLSLPAAIASLHHEFASVKDELRDAHREIDRLKRRLVQRQPSRRRLPERDIASLRRQTAFHCHPDRGGDPILMQRLNVLFDYLEEARDSVLTENGAVS